jgi:hypothetical protein
VIRIYIYIYIYIYILPEDNVAMVVTTFAVPVLFLLFIDAILWAIEYVENPYKRPGT